jgi:hypothetical protein
VHRPNYPYPVTIQLEAENLPDFLKKTYSSPILGGMDIMAINLRGGDQTVSNPWVSDTPAEFRRKLAEAFNEGIIKSIILNLASDSPDVSKGGAQEDPEEI